MLIKYLFTENHNIKTTSIQVKKLFHQADSGAAKTCRESIDNEYVDMISGVI